MIAFAVENRRQLYQALGECQGRLNGSAVLCGHHISAEENVIGLQACGLCRESLFNFSEPTLVKVREIYNAPCPLDLRTSERIVSHNQTAPLPLRFKKGGSRNADRRQAEREEKFLLIQSRCPPY